MCRGMMCGLLIMKECCKSYEEADYLRIGQWTWSTEMVGFHLYYYAFFY